MTHNDRLERPRRISLHGLIVDIGSVEEMTQLIWESVNERPTLIVTPNTDHFIRWQKNPRALFRSAYDRANFRTIDGSPLVLMARLAGAPHAVRVTGVDLLGALASAGATRNAKLSIVGGSAEAAHAAASGLISLYPGLRQGPILTPSATDLKDPEKLRDIYSILSEEAPDLIALCLGSPKQEEFFMQMSADITLWRGAYICAGAAVDFFGGRISRAPRVFQRLGIEWIYRLLREPRRLWRRYLVDDTQILPYMIRSVKRRYL